MSYLPLIMLGVLLNAAAQLFLKEGMRRIGHFEFVWANIVPITKKIHPGWDTLLCNQHRGLAFGPVTGQ